jgi:hypothetical protein
MKKLIIILSLISITFVTNAQVQQPDTLQLSPKEQFDFSSKWSNVGTMQSYIDFQKDVLSSSNLSIGIVGKAITSTLNLGYNKSSQNGKWEHIFSTSINPKWKYYGFGYGFAKNTDKRISTIQAYYSTDFDFQKDVSLSIIDVFKTKKFGSFGYSLMVEKTFWGEYEGEWQGKYTVDVNGNWVTNIYPINPPASQLIYRCMLMYTYTFKTHLVNISPQIFGMSDFYTVFKNGGTSDYSYKNDFNLDLYYAISMDWKITKKFILNTNIRFNKTFDKFGESVGFKKVNPIVFAIGTNFKF